MVTILSPVACIICLNDVSNGELKLVWTFIPGVEIKSSYAISGKLHDGSPF